MLLPKYSLYVLETSSLAVLSTKMLFLKFKVLTNSKNLALSAFSPWANFDCQSFRSIPFSSKTIVREFDMPITLMFNFKFSFKNLRCSFICSKNFAPTLPTPITNRFSCFIFSSKNSSCNAFKAFLTSFSSMIQEIFLSEAPCAITRMFTLFFPRVLNILPLSP